MLEFLNIFSRLSSILTLVQQTREDIKKNHMATVEQFAALTTLLRNAVTTIGMKFEEQKQTIDTLKVTIEKLKKDGGISAEAEDLIKGELDSIAAAAQHVIDSLPTPPVDPPADPVPTGDNPPSETDPV